MQAAFRLHSNCWALIEARDRFALVPLRTPCARWSCPLVSGRVPPMLPPFGRQRYRPAVDLPYLVFLPRGWDDTRRVVCRPRLYGHGANGESLRSVWFGCQSSESREIGRASYRERV